VKKAILFPIASHFLFHFYEIAFPALAIPLTLSLGMSLKDVLALGFPMYVAFGIFPCLGGCSPTVSPTTSP